MTQPEERRGIQRVNYTARAKIRSIPTGTRHSDVTHFMVAPYDERPVIRTLNLPVFSKSCHGAGKTVASGLAVASVPQLTCEFIAAQEFHGCFTD